MSAAASILLGASAVCLLLAIHPFITYPLLLDLLARGRPRPLQMNAGATDPRVAVCVCAYNEERVIRERVENILALRPTSPGLEILIYVDGATDATAEILRGFGDTITALISSERLGKTHGMNRLVGMTQADIVVFSDANVTFAPDALTRLIAPFCDPSVGCVCGHLLYPGAIGHTAQTGSLYWRLEEKIKSLESATGSVMGADGSIFAIRRSLHRPPPPNLIDDMYVSLSILCNGARIVRAADAIAFEPAVSTQGEEFRRKIRIACQSFNVHRALWPSLRQLPFLDLVKYVSHKLLRWLCIFSLAAAGILFALALAFDQAWMLLLLVTIIGGVCAGIIFTAQTGPATRLKEILLALIATGIGVLRSLRGEKFQTWTPPASARSVTALETQGG